MLVILALEKAFQHLVVTVALLADLGGVRAHVAADPRGLAIVGSLVGALFLACAFGMLRGRRWSGGGLLLLALIDIVGEFVAQGTVAIDITLSFVVAWLIVLVLAAGARGTLGPPPRARD